MKIFLKTVSVCLLSTSIYSYAHAQQGQKITASEILGKERNFILTTIKLMNCLSGFKAPSQEKENRDVG